MISPLAPVDNRPIVTAYRQIRRLMRSRPKTKQNLRSAGDARILALRREAKVHPLSITTYINVDEHV